MILHRDELVTSCDEFQQLHEALMEARTNYITLVERTPGATFTQVEEARNIYEARAAYFDLDERERYELYDTLLGYEGQTFVLESQVQAHLRDTTLNVGVWPYNCIDWDKATDLFLEGKTQINIGRHTYYALA